VPLKKITSRQDLAINGAQPALREPLHVGRPNIGDRSGFLLRVEEMFDRCWLSNNGPLVQELETSIAKFLGVSHCVAICNGTIALEIAIRALELKGEVIVPSYTFIATAHALHWQGLMPVFADIDPLTHSLDPAAVRRMITPRTSGILGVHLWGRGAAHLELQSLADEFGLKLMYDAAHAFGCSLDGTMIGNFGSCEVLSFHATKFFNTFEGGAIVTNDQALADKFRLMRNFGFAGVDSVIYPGTNGKMSEVCAAMGLSNFENLENIIEINLRNYDIYGKVISRIDGVNLFQFEHMERNNFQYVVLEVSDEFPVGRDNVVRALHAENVLARKYFWPGCHAMRPYLDLYPHARLMLPNTENVANRVVVLPTGPAVTERHIELIGSVLRVLGK